MLCTVVVYFNIIITTKVVGAETILPHIYADTTIIHKLIAKSGGRKTKSQIKDRRGRDKIIPKISSAQALHLLLHACYRSMHPCRRRHVLASQYRGTFRFMCSLTPFQTILDV